MKASYLAVTLLAASACKKKEEEGKPSPGTAGGREPEASKAAPDAAPAGPPDAAPARDKVTRLEGFDTPESVLHDEANDVYLVSNISGEPGGKDDAAFISRVTPDGKVELRWIDSAKEDVTLHAPKGMAIRDGVLYVADIDVVRKFDAASGAPKGELEVAGATFLNDLAVSDGTIWLSDSGFDARFQPTQTDAVYTIDGDDKVTKVFGEGVGAPAAELGHPNGVLGGDAANEVWVVTFGSGELYKVTYEGAEGGVIGSRSDVTKLPKGGLDGIVAAADDALLISSWEAGAVYRIAADGAPVELITGLNAPADIGYDAKRDRVLVPLFASQAVEIHPVK